MNLPSHSDAPLSYSTPETDRSTATGYAPSVPISVYRELAAELKASQSMVESLSSQNHQLTQQNHVLRREILRFAQAAEQLRDAVEGPQPSNPIPQAGALAIPEPPADLMPEPSDAPAERAPETTQGLAAQMTRMVKVKRPKPPAPQPSRKRPDLPTEQRLFTEQRQQEMTSTGSTPRPARDLSGLWLSTTILLIVFSAFGAGFLIMKPLLGNGR